MKLNPDCIRDILMFVENETTLYDPVEISPEDIPEFFNSYSSEEVMYHIKQCELTKLPIRYTPHFFITRRLYHIFNIFKDLFFCNEKEKASHLLFPRYPHFI